MTSKIDFKKKYLKYKSKYLALRNSTQLGGTDIIVDEEIYEKKREDDSNMDLPETIVEENDQLPEATVEADTDFGLPEVLPETEFNDEEMGEEIVEEKEKDILPDSDGSESNAMSEILGPRPEMPIATYPEAPVAIAPAPSPPPRGPKGQCTRDIDCADDEECIENKCIPAVTVINVPDPNDPNNNGDTIIVDPNDNSTIIVDPNNTTRTIYAPPPQTKTITRTIKKKKSKKRSTKKRSKKKSTKRSKKKPTKKKSTKKKSTKKKSTKKKSKRKKTKRK